MKTSEKKIHPAFIMLGTDIILALIIILFGVVICISKMSNIKEMVVISAGPIEMLNTMKTDMSVYYALKGEWPAGKEELSALLPDNKQWFEDMESGESEYSHYIKVIKYGAVHVTVKNSEENKRVTVRPAITADDPLGPVIWIAGRGEPRAGWTIIGEDHSTVNERYISKALK